MRKTLLILAAIGTFTTLAAPAHAQYCEGKVHGLSSHYNPATGSGFLAVRAGPKKTATQVGELFNGDKVEIFQRKGKWYKIATQELPLVEGWVHKSFLSNSCPY
jgi:SH3-like domain-containing protein